VSGNDYERLGDDAERLVEWIGNTAFMRLERVADDLLKCAALSIDARGGTFSCSIYETRPAVCRDLQRRSDACRDEIEAKSGRQKRALIMLARSVR
jgi:hypothetical protein